MSFSVMTHVISVFLISIENFYIPCKKTNQRKFVDSGIVKTQTFVRPPRLASSKIQQTKMLVACQRFGDLFLFGLVWQYSSVQTKYNKGRSKVMATYLQQ